MGNTLLLDNFGGGNLLTINYLPEGQKRKHTKKINQITKLILTNKPKAQ